MPTDQIALYFFLLLVVPGFIVRTVVVNGGPRREPNAQEWVAEVAVFGAINLIVAAIVLYILREFLLLFFSVDLEVPREIPTDPANALSALTAYGTLFLILPLVIGVYILVFNRAGRFGNFFRALRLQETHPIPRAWDFLFSQQKQQGVVVTLLDGTKVAGFMGTNSFASSAPNAEDLYLEQVYALNSGILTTEPVPNSGGVWIQGNQIRFVEFYVPLALQEGHDEHGERGTASTAAASDHNSARAG
jgi:hypothetical protein